MGGNGLTTLCRLDRLNSGAVADRADIATSDGPGQPLEKNKNARTPTDADVEEYRSVSYIDMVTDTVK